MVGFHHLFQKFLEVAQSIPIFLAVSVPFFRVPLEFFEETHSFFPRCWRRWLMVFREYVFGKKCFSPRPTPANAPLGFFSSSSYEEMMMATHVGCAVY